MLASNWRELPIEVRHECAMRCREMCTQPTTYMPCASRSFAASLAGNARVRQSHEDTTEIDFAVATRSLLGGMKRSEALSNTSLGYATNALILLELTEEGLGFNFKKALESADENYQKLRQRVKSSNNASLMAHAVAMLDNKEFETILKVFEYGEVTQRNTILRNLRTANKKKYADVRNNRKVRKLTAPEPSLPSSCHFVTVRNWIRWKSVNLPNRLMKSMSQICILVKFEVGDVFGRPCRGCNSVPDINSRWKQAGKKSTLSPEADHRCNVVAMGRRVTRIRVANATRGFKERFRICRMDTMGAERLPNGRSRRTNF